MYLFLFVLILIDFSSLTSYLFMKIDMEKGLLFVYDFDKNMIGKVNSPYYVKNFEVKPINSHFYLLGKKFDFSYF
jgi:hypothetical protein